MIISIKRTGGLVGIDETLGSIDTSDLQADIAEQVVNSAEKFTQVMETNQGEEFIGADLLQYEIEIIEEDGSHHNYVVFEDYESESEAVVMVRNLIEYL